MPTQERRNVLGALSLLLLAAGLVLSACSAASARDETVGGGGRSGNGSGGAGAGSSASGGTISIDPDSGGGGTDIGRECGGQTFPLERKPAKILMLLDRSCSMQDAPDGASDPTDKWTLTVPALKTAIGQTSAQISWGLKVFGEGDDAYCVVTDKIDVPVASGNSAAMTAAIDATTPNGDGTPTGEVVNAGVKYLKSLDAAGDTDKKYILLATDGEPSCMNGAQASQDTARPYAVQAVTAAAAAGYHTFVVGVSTTKEKAQQAMNDMAVAGLEPRPDNNPLATKFYAACGPTAGGAKCSEELAAAVSKIAGLVLDCRFTLTTPPAPGTNVGVRAGAETIPPDSWKLNPTDRSTVEVTGAWCDKIKTGSADAVRVVYGCPTDPVP